MPDQNEHNGYYPTEEELQAHYEDWLRGPQGDIPDESVEDYIAEMRRRKSRSVTRSQ